MRLQVHGLILASSAVGLLLAAGSTTPKASTSKKSAPVKTAAAAPAPSAASAAEFDATVKPLFENTCAGCHNDRLASGGFNLGMYANVASVTQHRDEWQTILQKIRSGEMPPQGIPKPPQAQIDAIVKLVTGEFEKADRNVKPDPGRVTARRLNRVEYANTIRDLLAVDYSTSDFPTDDSGYGFDNIGSVLTISPVLMDKYIAAAERISARAIGADPLPAKPIEFEYHAKDKKIRRPSISSIEASHRVDFDAEYIIRFGLPGERAADAKPVKLGFWMDGKLLESKMIETKPSGLVYFNPFSAEEMRLYLPEGDHTFRAGFIDDEFVKTLTERDIYSNRRNKFLDSMTFVGPFPSKVEKESRKKIFVCDPKTGQVCVDKILTTLARRAYRRPVTKAEVAALAKFVPMAKAEGQSVEQGIQLAIQAMLVSPHFLFRIERDVNPTDATKIHNISDVELASRLSYFLWSSMPDDELLGLAEAGKLRAAGVADQQIKRMMADPRASALAANFAGQWLETRNIDALQKDPKLFPEWNAGLREAMKTETRMFFEYLLRENRPLSEFLDAKYTFLNDRLAQHYGIEGVTGPEFRKVELTGDQRGGILTHASVLAVSSYPTRTSPVIRGKYILQNILGAPPPPPPADVPPLDEEAVGSTGSLRQQLEKHRSNAVCASCHSRMDPLGFSLENYDALGKWRAVDGKFPIDASGTLPSGKSFANPAEMKAVLRAQLPDFASCLTEKLLTYSLGRGLERYDRKTVEDITKKVAAADYQFQALINEIVRSLPFQSRRGEAVTSENSAKPKEVALR